MESAISFAPRLLSISRCGAGQAVFPRGGASIPGVYQRICGIFWSQQWRWLTYWGMCRRAHESPLSAHREISHLPLAHPPYNPIHQIIFKYHLPRHKNIQKARLGDFQLPSLRFCLTSSFPPLALRSCDPHKGDWSLIIFHFLKEFWKLSRNVLEIQTKNQEMLNCRGQKFCQKLYRN